MLNFMKGIVSIILLLMASASGYAAYLSKTEGNNPAGFGLLAVFCIMAAVLTIGVDIQKFFD